MLHGEISMSAEQRNLEMALQLLPAWFTARMMHDSWHFGVLMSDGTLIHIETILEVHQAADGSLWLDVQLSEETPFAQEPHPRDLKSPTSRTMASINVAHVMAAFETADT
jgi:hypothetical protein